MPRGGTAFTPPPVAAQIAFHNEPLLYALLISAAAAVLVTPAAHSQSNWVPGSACPPGLHTWTPTHHQHVHCVVRSGSAALPRIRYDDALSTRLVTRLGYSATPFMVSAFMLHSACRVHLFLDRSLPIKLPAECPAKADPSRPVSRLSRRIPEPSIGPTPRQIRGRS